MGYHNDGGPVYTAAFAAETMSTNPTDIFALLASSNSEVEILEIRAGMQSSAPVNQTLGMRVWRGTTGASTGAAITPRHIDGSTAMRAAVTGVTGPTSGVVSTTSAHLINADVWHFHDDIWVYKPCPPPIVNTSQRFHVNATAPSTASSIYGTITFRETGKLPS